MQSVSDHSLSKREMYSWQPRSNKSGSGAMIVAIAGMAHYYALNADNANPGGVTLKDDQIVEAFTRIMMDGIRGTKAKKKSK